MLKLHILKNGVINSFKLYNKLIDFHEKKNFNEIKSKKQGQQYVLSEITLSKKLPFIFVCLKIL